MITSSSAVFFDGVTSARHLVTIELAAAGVQIRSLAGEVLAEWANADIVAFAAPDGVLRLGRAGRPMPARLEIRDPALAAAVTAHTGAIPQFGAISPRTRVKVVGWSLAAVASAVLVAVFGVPAIAARVTPLVPVRLEQRLGVSVDAQVRSFLVRGRADQFECGNTLDARLGRAAFQKLVHKLETAAALPLPLHADVVRRPEANAIALPGGRVYVFQGLIAKADNADELAGVIAHEIGHIAHRDGVRTVIQAGSLSFLFGMLIGDFSGGGAAVIAMRTVVQSSYSRETEAAADAYGANLVARLGRDPRALGTILMRIAGTPGPMAKILLDHPEARERAAAIEAIAAALGPSPRAAALADGTGGGGPPGLLDAAEWAALKRICGGAAPMRSPGK
ncbi:MAG TPA: M48 family metallopeptidase [Xanthobacteraceae bacterium]